MKRSSAKQKGREGQKEVVDLIKKHLNLTDDDVRSNPASVAGEDIIIAKFARLIFPFSVEVKRVEKLNIDEGYAQAVSNAGEYIPLLVHRKNGKKWLVTLDFETFLEGFVKDKL